MKKNNAQHKMFAIISAIAVFLILSALAGCDADSVGQSNEDMTLDLSDPDVIAALLSASEGYDSWADEDSEEPKLKSLDGEPKTVWCLPLNCDEDKDGFAWECDKYIYGSGGAPLLHKGNVKDCQFCTADCTNCVAKEYDCEDEDHCLCPGESVPKYAIQFTEKRRCDHECYKWDGVDHCVLPAQMNKLFHEYMTPTSPLEGTHIYCILDGRVEISLKLGEATDQAPVHTGTPGSVFGEFILFEKTRRSATARAVKPVRIFAITAVALREIFAAHPEIGYPVMDNLCRILVGRVSKTTQELRSSLMW